MPVDRGAIDAQLREIGEGARWWELREFRDLPYVLYADERIRGIVVGKVQGGRGPRLPRRASWLLIATDQRLIGLKQERFGRKQMEIARGQLTRVQESNRLRCYQMTLSTSVGRYRLRIPKADAFRFSEALRPLHPRLPVPQLHPDLEALAWVPGIRTVAALPGFSGIIAKVSMLSAQGYAPQNPSEDLEGAVERLQSDVEKLQQQVKFLEDLLQKRAEVVQPGLTDGFGDTDW